ncbi:MAG TPA: DUF2911 domain-containing protein [Gemmatimonadales bacterium]|nr:DUF2911 domain-containing protein [Gemmatimonadales bacterium]
MSLSVTLSLIALLAPPRAATPERAAADTACQVLLPNDVPVEGRKSPLDSLTFTVAKQPVKICYGRPSSRGRTMLGGEAVPYGKLWRTGANEPTIFFTPVALTVAGIAVAPGKYSLYTVPTAGEWEIIVNRSTSQWGEESNYTPEVQRQEVGRAKVKSESLKAPIETFTIRSQGAGSGATLVLEWERTRVSVPIKPAS